MRGKGLKNVSPLFKDGKELKILAEAEGEIIAQKNTYFPFQLP